MNVEQQLSAIRSLLFGLHDDPDADEHDRRCLAVAIEWVADAEAVRVGRRQLAERRAAGRRLAEQVSV